MKSGACIAALSALITVAREGATTENNRERSSEKYRYEARR
jgi:hypothetical protein